MRGRGTSDISAGQLIDRTGVLLGLPFPAGKALDALASESGPVRGFPVKLNDLTFSLSGMENKVKALAEQGEPPAEIARFTLETVASAVRRPPTRPGNAGPACRCCAPAAWPPTACCVLL